RPDTRATIMPRTHPKVATVRTVADQAAHGYRLAYSGDQASKAAIAGSRLKRAEKSRSSGSARNAPNSTGSATNPSPNRACVVLEMPRRSKVHSPLIRPARVNADHAARLVAATISMIRHRTRYKLVLEPAVRLRS